MNPGPLAVSIDGVAITAAQIENWEAGRIRAVLPKLRRILKERASARTDHQDLAALREELLRLKEQCGRDVLRHAVRGEVRVSGALSKLLVRLSGSRRKQCVTEIKVTGCSAQQISQAIDDMMCNETPANRQSNLVACPDHYVLEARDGVLEVIETTGGSPFPSQFFLRFDDESGLATPRDSAFAYQSAGTARAADGTVLGGVRHQFRDDEGGALARLMVEFPQLTPNSMIRAHQLHLACEWSYWLHECIRRAHRRSTP